MSTTLDHARRYVAAGLSVFPTKLDGSKEPAFSGWREYAERLPTHEELQRWFRLANRCGIGIAGGIVSGNLIVLDFETLDSFLKWAGKLSADEKAALANSPIIRTPKGGRHVYIRTVEPIKGCKLARTTVGETLIETRGCQHYVVAPGSPLAVHPTGKPYTIARAGWLKTSACPLCARHTENGSEQQNVSVDNRLSVACQCATGNEYAARMSLEVFHGLTVHAAELNEYIRPAAHEVVRDRQGGGVVGNRPGDHFNGRVSWGDILGPHGWKVFRATQGATYWSRPGKSPAGVSASTGHCKGQSSGDLLYVFSTSATPFEAEVSYSRFAAYSLLNHRGDFAAATKALGLAGYGESREEWLKRQPSVGIGGRLVRA